MTTPEPKTLWHNPETWGLEGKGWNDTERYYDRLPAKAKAMVPEVVWNLRMADVVEPVLREALAK